MAYNFIVMNNFGQWLRDQRLALKLKQSDIATKAKVSVSYISTLERNQPNSSNGKDIRPEPEVVEAIARAVNGDVNEALEFFGYKAKSDFASTDDPELTLAMEQLTGALLASGLEKLPPGEIREAYMADVRAIALAMLNERVGRQKK